MNKTMNCHDCGKELPGSVIDAGNFLYHGGTLSVSDLAESLERSFRPSERARWDGEMARFKLPPSTDRQIVEMAVRSLLDGSPEDLAAAVRHYGDLGDPDGSECERIEAAKWCHARDEILAKGTSDEWARSLCTLEAGHTPPHSFEQTVVEAAR